MKHINIFNLLQQTKYAAKTGIVFDIQNIGKNTKLIATREKKSLKEIRQGVWLKTEVIDFADGNFTNVYDLFWNPNQVDISPSINSSNKPYFLQDQIKNDPTVIALIDGGFFFLSDKASRGPVDLPYNLCIRNGNLLGLPSSDQPIIYVQSSKLKTKEAKAAGTMSIKNQKISWVGAQSQEIARGENVATLYNSKCSDVVKVRDQETGIQIGILDEEHITTPKNKEVFDLVIKSDKEGDLRIAKINAGGGTHFFDGLFILQMKSGIKKYHFGDLVTEITLDGLELQTVYSGISIGKRVDDPFFLETIRRDRRDARSLIAEDMQGHIHFMVFDGSKYIPGFRGISAEDITPFFPHNKFKWAYFLDGGGSSRLIVRNQGEIKYLANKFVFRKLKDGTLLWDWKKGRIQGSSISLRQKDT